MQKGGNKRQLHSDKHQAKPGLEYRMQEPPLFESPQAPNAPKLLGKVAMITGGDSGIGRAVAIGFARNGADVSICYLRSEEKDAQFTKELVNSYGRKCLLIPGSVANEKHCRSAVEKTHKAYGRLDILVNNAGTHTSVESLESITSSQLHQTFETNVYPMFYLAKEALKYLPSGGSIINTTSVTAYRGSAHLIDYSASKGAIVSFTRSLSSSLSEKGIRVNAVAPGPIWTPLIVSGFKDKEIANFGSDSPMGRNGEPYEVAACYIFLASDDSSYITGQVLHPNGGEIVNS